MENEDQVSSFFFEIALRLKTKEFAWCFCMITQLSRDCGLFNIGVQSSEYR